MYKVYWGFYKDNIGVKETKIEATIMGLYYWFLVG